MTISPFTPLFFRDGARRSDSIESRYMQTFATGDGVLIECICDSGEAAPTLYLINERTGARQTISLTAFAIGEKTLRYAVLMPPVGEWRVENASKSLVSYPFRVTDNDAELAHTTLVQYSMKSNSQRTDGVFVIDGVRRFFSFRVPGGFKDSDVTYACDSEQFTTQQGDISTLHSVETVLHKFTMGCQIGVPVRFATLLNRLLSCTFVYFDGVRYERKDGAVPEATVLNEGIDSFVYKVQLQRVQHLCPTLAEGMAESVDDEMNIMEVI